MRLCTYIYSRNVPLVSSLYTESKTGKYTENNMTSYHQRSLILPSVHSTLLRNSSIFCLSQSAACLEAAGFSRFTSDERLSTWKYNMCSQALIPGLTLSPSGWGCVLRIIPEIPCEGKLGAKKSGKMSGSAGIDSGTSRMAGECDMLLHHGIRKTREFDISSGSGRDP